MEVLEKIPTLKVGLILLAVYGFAWISLEGDPRWSSIMALITLLVGAGYLAKKLVRGRTINGIGWMVLLASCGLVIGLLFGPFTLFYMALKTGLHGHWAEFTRAEMLWFIDGILLWVVSGLLAGAVLGFLTTAFKQGAN
ncbi:MAG: hypothetical protein BMS9Abin02_2079 [Anaerolineae bacterium]|nr:MAG: hypothetical protein BMS9Abin02_2079 [Anaerolineae bacterium]